MSLKIEDVKAGDELECVDRKGFTLGKRAVNEPILEMKEIIVQSISSKNLIYVHDKNNSDNFFIYESELKYFKKKEQSQQYTFDDLVDVARKAFNDGLILSISESWHGQMVERQISFRISEEHDVNTFNESYHAINSVINIIQSLYKETFVIKSEEDIKKIGRTLDVNKVELTNGITLSSDDLLEISHYTNEFLLKLLKGATVEQERGRND